MLGNGIFENIGILPCQFFGAKCDHSGSIFSKFNLHPSVDQLVAFQHLPDTRLRCC